MAMQLAMALRLAQLAFSKRRSFRPRAQVKVSWNEARLQQAIAEGVANSISRAAYLTSTAAKASIVTSRKPSPPGQPPHTRGKPRKNLRAAIAYAIDRERQEAIIGPRGDILGQAAHYHEHGGRRGKATFQARPTMVPALERVAPVFAAKFHSQLGG